MQQESLQKGFAPILTLIVIATVGLGAAGAVAIVGDKAKTDTKIASKVDTKLSAKSETNAKEKNKAENESTISGQAKTNVVAKLQANLDKHSNVLAEVLRKVPKQAKDAIAQALENSQHGLGNSIEQQTKHEAEGSANTNTKVIVKVKEKENLSADISNEANANTQVKIRGLLGL